MRQSDATRLRRAERDLLDAEAALERVCGYEPTSLTSREDIRAMRESAENRVYRLRARVAIRRDAFKPSMRRIPRDSPEQ